MTDTAALVSGPTQEASAHLDAYPDTFLGADLGGTLASAPALDPLAFYDVILLQLYGEPRRPEDILPLTRNATADHGMSDFCLVEASGRYRSIGDASPINVRSAELCGALQTRLAKCGSTLPIIVDNHNWYLFVNQALRELTDAGARRVLALPTAAFDPYSGCRQYRKNLVSAAALLADSADSSTSRGFEADATVRVGGNGGSPVELTVDKTRPYYNAPGLLQADIDATVKAYGTLAGQGAATEGARLAFVIRSIPLDTGASLAPGDGTGGTHNASGVSDPTGVG